MARALTDSTLQGIKPPDLGRWEVADLRCAGLSFRITASGVRSWCFRFKDPATGVDARSTIGRYPDISLGQARKAADCLRAEVAKGINPVTQKKLNRADASTKTFGALAARYIEEHARRFKKSSDSDERNLRLHILPKWQKLRYDKIRRADVIQLVEGMVKAGSPMQANRVQSLISKVYSFALDADLVDANPCLRLRKRGSENRGTRVLSDAEINQFWKRAVLPPVSRRVGLALRLALLTGSRATEAAGIHRSELTDLATAGKASWLLPAARSKNKRAHLVPLSELARQTIVAAIDLIGDEDDYVFPSPVEKGGPITGHALTVAMRRLTKTIDGEAGKSWKADAPSPHDLRRTFGTRLSALGVPKEDREACLNHVRSDVGVHYDLYQRSDEKRRALCLWESSLSQILGANRGS